MNNENLKENSILKKQKLVSVVIPTYNRYVYLKECISSILSINSDDIEIVVQDNTEDNSEILSFLEKVKDYRLKYYHRKEHISVMENCDAAVMHSTGKYVCMIGDDDTVCSSIVNAALYCESHGYDACCFIFPGFNWPDMTFETKKAESNLFFKYEADGSVMSVDAKAELKTAAKMGGALTTKMPRLYHGLVGRECLDRIYEKVGTYFPGPSPDMANGTAVCLEAQNTVFIRDYLIVSGYGHNSARGEGNRGQHYGKIEEKPWLPKNILQRWNRELPKIFSAETIIAQSMTEALMQFKADDYLKEFNYGKLYATFWWHHRDASMKIFVFLIKKPLRIIKFVCGLFNQYVERRKMKKMTKTKNYMEFQFVKTLAEAQKITEAQRVNVKVYV